MTQIQETPALTATRWECQCDSGTIIRTDDAAEAADWVIAGRAVKAYALIGVMHLVTLSGAAPVSGKGEA